MDYRLMVYDDFFAHPEKVREKALEQKFDHVTTYFPGRRTDQCRNILPDLFNELETAVKPLIPANTIIETAVFQTQDESDYRKIHQDTYSVISGVIYLDIEPIPNSGTGFYTHIETGWDGSTPKPNSIEYINDLDFERTTVIENKFNRMIIYDGRALHSAEGAGDQRLTIMYRIYNK